jgi:hypothetical protein
MRMNAVPLWLWQQGGVAVFRGGFGVGKSFQFNAALGRMRQATPTARIWVIGHRRALLLEQQASYAAALGPSGTWLDCPPQDWPQQSTFYCCINSLHRMPPQTTPPDVLVLDEINGLLGGLLFCKETAMLAWDWLRVAATAKIVLVADAAADYAACESLTEARRITHRHKNESVVALRRASHSKVFFSTRQACSLVVPHPRFLWRLGRQDQTWFHCTAPVFRGFPAGGSERGAESMRVHEGRIQL